MCWSMQAVGPALHPVQVWKAVAALPWGGGDTPLSQGKATAASVDLHTFRPPLESRTT